jgi:hypothetical protein
VSFGRKAFEALKLAGDVEAPEDIRDAAMVQHMKNMTEYKQLKVRGGPPTLPAFLHHHV